MKRIVLVEEKPISETICAWKSFGDDQHRCDFVGDVKAPISEETYEAIKRALISQKKVRLVLEFDE